jgi:3-phenylpropionate/trans-cinnamate dioxygenase ferredoxin subunit
MSEVRVFGVDDLGPGSSRRVDVAGHRVCVVRIDDDWYAVADECSHEDYSLAEGIVLAEECEIECPKHGSAFSLTSGEPQSLPATKPVATYAVRRDGDDILVTLP